MNGLKIIVQHLPTILSTSGLVNNLSSLISTSQDPGCFMIFARLVFGDQSDLVLVKDVIPCPVDEHQNAIAKTDQAIDV